MNQEDILAKLILGQNQGQTDQNPGQEGQIQGQPQEQPQVQSQGNQGVYQGNTIASRFAPGGINRGGRRPNPVGDLIHRSRNQQVVDSSFAGERPWVVPSFRVQATTTDDGSFAVSVNSHDGKTRDSAIAPASGLGEGAYTGITSVSNNRAAILASQLSAEASPEGRAFFWSVPIVGTPRARDPMIAYRKSMRNYGLDPNRLSRMPGTHDQKNRNLSNASAVPPPSASAVPPRNVSTAPQQNADTAVPGAACPSTEERKKKLEKNRRRRQRRNAKNQAAAAEKVDQETSDVGNPDQETSDVGNPDQEMSGVDNPDLIRASKMMDEKLSDMMDQKLDQKFSKVFDMFKTYVESHGPRVESHSPGVPARGAPGGLEKSIHNPAAQAATKAREAAEIKARDLLGSKNHRHQLSISSQNSASSESSSIEVGSRAGTASPSAFDIARTLYGKSSKTETEKQPEKQPEKQNEPSAVSGGWAKMSRVWGHKIYDEDITDPNFKGRDRPGWTPCFPVPEHDAETHDAQTHAAKLELQRQKMQKVKCDTTTAQTEPSTVASIRDEQAAKLKRVKDANSGVQ